MSNNKLIKLTHCLFLTIIFLLSGCASKNEITDTSTDLQTTPYSNSGQKYKTYEVTTGSIVETTTDTGYLYPNNLDSLLIKQDNVIIKNVYVKDYELIKKGQVIADFEIPNKDTILEENRIPLQNAIDIYNATKNQRKKDIQNFEKYVNNLKDDYEKTKSEADTKTQKQKLLEIKTQETNLKKQKIDFETYINDNEFSLQEQQQKFTELEEILSQTQTTAPYDGAVVSITRLQPGSEAKKGEVIAVMTDMENFQIVINGKDEGNNIHFTGMNSDITFEKDVKLTGKVVMSQDSLPLTANRDYEITLIQIDGGELPSISKYNPRIQVQTTTKTLENITLLQKNLLEKDGDRTYVFVSENGSKKKVYIETGVSDRKYIEVLKGLKEGDQVIIN